MLLSIWALCEVSWRLKSRSALSVTALEAEKTMKKSAACRACHSGKSAPVPSFPPQSFRERASTPGPKSILTRPSRLEASRGPEEASQLRWLQGGYLEYLTSERDIQAIRSKLSLLCSFRPGPRCKGSPAFSRGLTNHADGLLPSDPIGKGRTLVHGKGNQKNLSDLHCFTL